MVHARGRDSAGIEGGLHANRGRGRPCDGSGLSASRPGPANLPVLDERSAQRHLRAIARSLPRPVALAIGMAGARTTPDPRHAFAGPRRAWCGPACPAMRERSRDALMASGGETSVKGGPAARVPSAPACLIVSGTDRAVSPRGRRPHREGRRWGHIIRDRGERARHRHHTLKPSSEVVPTGTAGARWERLLSACWA